MDNRKVVYIKAEQFIEVPNYQVKISDIISMECMEKDIVEKLKEIVVLNSDEKKNKRYVISILKVIEAIHKVNLEIEVQNIGATDIIIEVGVSKREKKILQIFTVFIVMVIIFCGAAFSVMTFVNDGGVTIVMDNIYEMMTGKESDGFTILEVSYSIGLVLGIILFFNRIGNKKSTCDPTPMEIEMRKYEEDIQTTVIQNYSRKETEIEVDD